MENKFNFLPIPAINAENEVWLPAIYNGRPIKGMIVSNHGWYRRLNKTGGYGQESKGTPSFNRACKNRLRQFMVTITFDDKLEGEKHCTTVNLHRVLCCTFQGVIFAHGDDVDHKDLNVANGYVGSPEGNFFDGNLRKVTHSENMHNRGVVRRTTGLRSPVASEYGYRIRMQLGCRRLIDLPKPYLNEYYRLVSAEHRGRPAIPRTITMAKGTKRK